jgi:hypothetical protein
VGAANAQNAAGYLQAAIQRLLRTMHGIAEISTTAI